MPSLLSSSVRVKKALRMCSKAQPDSESVAPLDCIFACSVCGDVFSDIYQQHRDDTVYGLSDGINPKDRIVTRLYVASCCHVICIKHIEDGNGPAFHQAGQQPQAPCPVCIKESGDDTAKQLFSVRGFGEDEHDPAIPKCWFKAPPMKLEGKDKEMEALRFQYLALMRYSKNITSAYRQATQHGAETETKLRSMQGIAAEEHEKAMSLQQELERLRPLEGTARKLQRLEARLPAIRHYLNFLPRLGEERKMMQDRLASLGFSMPLMPVPEFHEPFPLDENGNFIEEEAGDAIVGGRKTGSSHTVGRSAHNTGYGEERESPSSSQSRRPFKRSRVDSPARANNIHAAPSSRDMMPPPPKSISRMKSIRKIIPTIRNKISNGRSAPASVRKPAADLDPDVQMYDNGQWEKADPSQPSDIDERPPTRHGRQSEAPYMSGALPAGQLHPMNILPQSRLLSGLGIHSNDSNFTFEAPPPMEMPSQQPGNMPTQPSYMHLLDGLGRHTGLDLGLDDPRHQPQEEQPPPYQPKQQMRQLQPSGEAQNHQKQWTFGHAFLQQSPVNANSTSAHRNSGLDHDRQNDAIMGNAHDHVHMNLATPAPIRSQRPVDEVDHIVSPFFGNSKRHSQPFSRSQFAEPEVSSHRSATYQSHHQKPSTEMDWCEPRSLNGLSFFNSPVNERNERIEWRREAKPPEYPAHLSQHRVRSVNSQGLLMRPDIEYSPVRNDSTYGSLDRSHPRQIRTQSHSTIPFMPLGRPSHSRATRLPSAMPSIIASQSPARIRSRTGNLGVLGVRSSQHSRPLISGNAFTSPARTGYSSAGRRVIRR